MRQEKIPEETHKSTKTPEMRARHRFNFLLSGGISLTLFNNRKMAYTSSVYITFYNCMHENPPMFERKQERTFRADDPKSLETFLHKWKRYIYTIIRRKGIPANEVEDVFQEVSLALSRSSSDFDPAEISSPDKEKSGF